MYLFSPLFIIFKFRQANEGIIIEKIRLIE